MTEADRLASLTGGSVKEPIQAYDQKNGTYNPRWTQSQAVPTKQPASTVSPFANLRK